MFWVSAHLGRTPTSTGTVVKGQTGAFSCHMSRPPRRLEPWTESLNLSPTAVLTWPAAVAVRPHPRSETTERGADGNTDHPDRSEPCEDSQNPAQDLKTQPDFQG